MIRAGQLRRLSITVLAVLTIAVGAAQLIPGPDDPVRTPLPEAVGETAAVAAAATTGPGAAGAATTGPLGAGDGGEPAPTGTPAGAPADRPPGHDHPGLRR